MRRFVEAVSGRALATAFALMIFLSSASSGGLNAYFSKDDDRKSASIDFSECTAEEVDECISHSVSCSEDSWFSPEFVIIVGPVETIATRLIAGTEGAAEGQLVLTGGWVITLEINAVEVVANELDGGWMLTLRIANGETMFDALTGASSEQAYLDFAGERFLLAPQPGDGAKLMEWKTACTDFRRKAAHAAATWTPYGNARFGYRIEIPPGFSDIVEAANGDGGIIKSADGNVELSVWGSHITESDFAADIWNRLELSNANGWKITYQKKTDEWASWSGTKGSRVMYQRAIALCDTQAAFFFLEYDATEVAALNPVVERLVASFKSGDCH